ncbi:lipopolysaccharide biosynthesis protein [Hymenobacter arizonensis]|uniref:Membrane protein involved in the export of O-antigen and teichoic acid n=1 Tax=Hymenobacter arizonensis TaxID=1227077 RepID=A0A1I5T4G2_HYMAR|nr:polysaccharide biosynthesis C-terminal domain-containing protein [Hymenobacter arizonensis]SFP77396.1 Membrane protein involved in the export of O-antigen and teichoic acid [Hymenobacter arizonensis]
MGIVQRQGIRNTLISYVGLAIGFVNTILILPRLLTPGQIGLTGLLVSFATIGAQVSAFGFGSAGLRYFPYFRNQGRNHGGFLPLLLGLPLLGFVLVAIIMSLGKPLVLRWYSAEDAMLLSQHYRVAIALAGAIMLGALQDAYLKSLFHTSFASFCQEILLRLLIVGAAVAYSTHYISFEGFVLAYAGAYAVVAVLLACYLAVIGELHLRPTRAALRIKPLGEMLAFGGFALMSNISGTVLLNIDSIMVGAKISFAAAGIYLIATNISTALTLPFRALNKTAFALIAEYWKESDMGKMGLFYQRVTRVNTLLGCYLALGIGLNLDFIFGLIHRPEYAAGSTAVLLLLAARLFDGITGVNATIVVTSPRYRLDLLFNSSLAIAVVALNWLLIPRLGLNGAALSYGIALVSINVARTWFVWQRFGLQPFDGRIARILAVAAGAGLVAWALPETGNIWLTLLLRGGVLTVLYTAGVLLTHAAPEAEALLANLRNRLAR